MSKLGAEYVVFVSTFYTVRLATGATWKMPTLDAFIESLIHEQDKLIKMGTLKNSSVHALVVHGSGKNKSKSNQQSKGNEKKEPYPRKEGNPKPLDGSTSSKEKDKKGKSKCSYCNHGYHPESSCMKKTIDLMAQTLQQNNLGNLISKVLRRSRKKKHQK